MPTITTVDQTQLGTEDGGGGGDKSNGKVEMGQFGHVRDTLKGDRGRPIGRQAWSRAKANRRDRDEGGCEEENDCSRVSNHIKVEPRCGICFRECYAWAGNARSKWGVPLV